MEIENAVRILNRWLRSNLRYDEGVIDRDDPTETEFKAIKILIDYVEKQQKINDAVLDASRIISRN